MIKDILNSNDSVLPSTKQIDVLKENFPACFKVDGSFDIERFKEYLSEKLFITNEGYELRFLGKNYARLLASLDTTTVIVPDEEHNSKPENKDSRNLYLSGDNLDGLKHLLKSYEGLIKCIYIDPPYNTGSDAFVYKDNFTFSVDELATKLSIDEEQAKRILDLTKRGSASHSAWLMFMYPRLQLARDLLTDDGVMFISIDDNEQANLKLLCDDIFGEESFVANICHKARSSISNDKIISNSHNSLFLYARKMDKVHENRRRIGLEPDLNGFNKDDNDGKGPYKLVPVDGPGDEAKGNPYYEFLGVEDYFRFSYETMKKMYQQGLIVKRGESLQQKYYLSEAKNSRKRVNTWWDEGFLTSNATKALKDLMGDKVFNNPKNVDLIIKILKMFFNDDEEGIMLDFFSGSATTADAVMQFNAEYNKKIQYIMIQINNNLDEQLKYEKTDSDKKKTKKTIDYLEKNNRPHTLDSIGIERIERKANKLKQEKPNTTADLGFKHYILQEPNTITLDKLEKFNLDGLFATNDILKDFGTQTVLTTWLVRDGYGFNADVKAIDFAGYIGYYIDKHLYLIDSEIKEETIAAIVEKYETDGSFNPENVVLFGYSFVWTMVEELRINLARLKDTEKNLRINFDVRY